MRVGSPQCIDIAAVLAPISGDAPAGVNIRDDVSATSSYFKLKDARSAARLAEKRADAEGEDAGLLQEWRVILDLAPRTLAEKTKDLEISAWLIEALGRSNGFAGLRDGFRVARGLVEQYWEQLYSLQDEDGVATKVAPLTGLNGAGGGGTLIQPIRKIALTKAVGEGPFAAYQYEQAWNLAEITDPEVRARKEQSGVVTLERFMAAANASGGAYYVTLLDDIGQCIEELDGLSAALDQTAGEHAPPTTAIRDVLLSIQEVVQRFSKDLVARVTQVATREDTQVVAAENGNGAVQHVASGGTFRLNGGAQTREEALRVLLQVAEYFRINEPHSPVATTLEELVRRARMPFSELLLELLADRTAWRSALTSAGIKPPDEVA